MCPKLYGEKCRKLSKSLVLTELARGCSDTSIDLLSCGSPDKPICNPHPPGLLPSKSLSYHPTSPNTLRFTTLHTLLFYPPTHPSSTREVRIAISTPSGQVINTKPRSAKLAYIHLCGLQAWDYKMEE